jgi:hypothetical protein
LTLRSELEELVEKYRVLATGNVPIVALEKLLERHQVLPDRDQVLATALAAGIRAAVVSIDGSPEVARIVTIDALQAALDSVRPHLVVPEPPQPPPRKRWPFNRR